MAIIGPNGAGKTTLLNVHQRLLPPVRGPHPLRGPRPHAPAPPDVAALGIARTFQNVALFKGMSVLDNIMTGRLLKMRGSFLLDALYWGPARRQELEHRAVVERIIDFLEIQAIRKTPAGRLPYGLQKRVELARALAAEPQLLLLDEPMAGMNVEEKEDMCRFILDVNEEFGTTIALIEHDMGVVMDISDRVVVLDYGRKIADGPPEQVRKDPACSTPTLGSPTESSPMHVDCVRVFVAPFKDMADQPAFLVEVRDRGDRSPGSCTRSWRSGFVLIFKASGRVQLRPGRHGAVRRPHPGGAHGARRAGAGRARADRLVMMALAFAIERVVLRPLVNQAHIILFMATIGLNFFLEGFGEMVWGANVKKLDVGIPDRSFMVAGRPGQPARAVGRRSRPAVLVAVLAAVFQRTRIGRALRAVADDHEAALSIGIPLKTIWVVVWSVAGLVAIVAGLMWGAKSGVQFSLSLIALKALPVLILGGFESVPGRHRGRAHHRGGGEDRRGVLGPARRRRHRELVRLRPRPRVPAVPAARPLRREDH